MARPYCTSRWIGRPSRRSQSPTKVDGDGKNIAEHRSLPQQRSGRYPSFMLCFFALRQCPDQISLPHTRSVPWLLPVGRRIPPRQKKTKNLAGNIISVSYESVRGVCPLWFTAYSKLWLGVTVYDTNRTNPKPDSQPIRPSQPLVGNRIFRLSRT